MLGWTTSTEVHHHHHSFCTLHTAQPARGGGLSTVAYTEITQQTSAASQLKSGPPVTHSDFKVPSAHWAPTRLLTEGQTEGHHSTQSLAKALPIRRMALPAQRKPFRNTDPFYSRPPPPRVSSKDTPFCWSFHHVPPSMPPRMRFLMPLLFLSYLIP